MKNKELKILLSAPRGFCAGVERAIEIVEKSIQKFGAPVYVRHEIVHNKHVVDDLKNKGAIFVEELEEIKDKTRPVIFSAHGVPKKIPENAKNYKMTYVDATCPLVSKVHREAENLNKAGYQIILIGHKNHAVQITRFLILYFSFFSKKYSSNICGKVKDAKPIKIIFNIALFNS